jgi:hypothetical protein
LIFSGLIVVVMGCFALINFQEAVVSPLTYFIQRPFQVESIASSLLWVGSLLGVPYQLAFTYGSLNITSNFVGIVSPLFTCLLLAGLSGIFLLQLKGRMSFAQSMVAIVGILMATGKVFSPQYLLWLFPLLAYVYARGEASRRIILLWSLVGILTTIIYLGYYARMPNFATAAQVLPTLWGFFPLVALRNCLLSGTVIAFLGAEIYPVNASAKPQSQLPVRTGPNQPLLPE